MILPYQKNWPYIHETAFVASSADIIGKVKIFSHASIWFQTLIRGDTQSIHIGEQTNIQDHCVLYGGGQNHPLKIGSGVTVCHHASLQGCEIGNHVFIGVGSIILDQVKIGNECWIEAGTILPQGMSIPSQSLVVGQPGKVVRSLTIEEINQLVKFAKNYVKLAEEYYGSVPSPSRNGHGASDLGWLARALEEDG